MMNEIPKIEILINTFHEIHIHPHSELLYVLAGALDVQIDANRFVLNTDDILIVNENQQHKHTARDTSTIAVQLALHSERSDSSAISLYWCNSAEDPDPRYDPLRKCLRTLLNYRYIKKDGDNYLLHAQWYLLMNLLHNGFLVTAAQSEVSAPNNKRNEYILQYLNQNYNHKASLQELSAQLYLSPDYLSRYIKKEFGASFMEVLTNIRLRHAVTDLLYSDDAIIQVALNNGFPSASTFNTIFKEQYGASPSKYRSKMKVHQSQTLQEQRSIQNKIKTILLQKDNIATQDNLCENVRLDVEKTRAFSGVEHRMINAGTAKDLLSSSIQKQILYLRDRIGYRYVRFWNLFTKDLLITRTVSKTQDINFDLIDRCTDFLVENGMKPYIELRIKPYMLMAESLKHFLYADDDVKNEEKDYFCHIVKKYITHLVNRYGIREIETWYFELWRRPVVYRNTQESDIYYFELFDQIYSTIKHFAPNANVGGAGFSYSYGEKDINQCVQMWAERACTPDFISLYCYPYHISIQDGQMITVLDYDKHFLIHSAQKMRQAMQRAGMGHKALHISEWSSSASSRNILNDSCFKGAYIIKNSLECMEEVEMLGYWVASDLYADFYDSKNMLNGVGGLLTKNGIPKPAMYAERFLSKMKGELVDKGDFYIATRNENTINILCYNYKHFGYRLNFFAESTLSVADQDMIFDDLDEKTVRFTVSNVPPGAYRMRAYTVNEKHGSIQSLLNKMNLQANLSKPDIEHLHNVCIPRLEIRDQFAEGGIIEINHTLLPNEMLLIQIQHLLN